MAKLQPKTLVCNLPPSEIAPLIRNATITTRTRDAAKPSCIQGVVATRTTLCSWTTVGTSVSEATSPNRSSLRPTNSTRVEKIMTYKLSITICTNMLMK